MQTRKHSRIDYELTLSPHVLIAAFVLSAHKFKKALLTVCLVNELYLGVVRKTWEKNGNKFVLEQIASPKASPQCKRAMQIRVNFRYTTIAHQHRDSMGRSSVSNTTNMILNRHVRHTVFCEQS